MRQLDVSVVMPFTDHEEVIGAACRRLAGHLERLNLRFEIIAVDEGSFDNSQAVLTLLRKAVPELSLARAAAGRGFSEGVESAVGRVFWLIDVDSAKSGDLSHFDVARHRVASGIRDLLVVGERYAVLSRARAGAEALTVRGTPPTAFQRLARRARANGLGVEAIDLAGAGAQTIGGRAIERLFDAIAPARVLLQRQR